MLAASLLSQWVAGIARSAPPLPSFPAATRPAPRASLDRQLTAFPAASRNPSTSPSGSRRLRQGRRAPPPQFRPKNDRKKPQKTQSTPSNLQENQRQRFLPRRS